MPRVVGLGVLELLDDGDLVGFLRSQIPAEIFSPLLAYEAITRAVIFILAGNRNLRRRAGIPLAWSLHREDRRFYARS